MGHGMSWVITVIRRLTRREKPRFSPSLKNHRKVSDLPTSRTSDLPGSSRASPWPPPSHNGAAETERSRRGSPAGSEYTRSGEEHPEKMNGTWTEMGLKWDWKVGIFGKKSTSIAWFKTWVENRNFWSLCLIANLLDISGSRTSQISG